MKEFAENLSISISHLMLHGVREEVIRALLEESLQKGKTDLDLNIEDAMARVKMIE